MSAVPDATALFLAWLRLHGVTLNNRDICKIGLHTFEQTGRGTIALCDIHVRSLQLLFRFISKIFQSNSFDLFHYDL